MQKIIRVGEENQKERLDKFLSAQFPDLSRSYIQKTIKENKVLVNNKKVPVHYFLKVNDKITLDFSPPEKLKLVPIKKIPKIIHEEDDFIIIEKPAGLIVHPANSKDKETLAGQLISYLPALKSIGEDKLRPGIVHRLDKNVSGIMVVAKNQKMFKHLKNQFIRHKVKKEYIALVYGRVKKMDGLITLPIARSKEGKFVARPKNALGKKAITKYECLKHIKSYSLLKLTTLTGRTHQIRAHLTALGYPIIGDKDYFLLKNKRKEIKINRLLLHAEKIGFFDLKNQWREFESKPPQNFNDFIKNLEQS